MSCIEFHKRVMEIFHAVDNALEAQAVKLKELEAKLEVLKQKMEK